MAEFLSFEKLLNTLPETFTPNTMYMVRDGASFRLFVSDSTGTSAIPHKAAAEVEEPIEPFLLMGVGHG